MKKNKQKIKFGMVELRFMIMAKIRQHWQLLSFLALSLVVRLVNLKNVLFFTWDNGRDFFAIQKIAQGDIILLGPTTGLQGWFLGPFWYYLGLPGYWLSGGNPYLFLSFYIAVTLLALPLFWYLGHLLFKKNKVAAVMTALLLSLTPGSIWGTLRVWNPQIGILLVTCFYLSLIKARKSKLFLGVAGLSLGLLLQSQFAYGIFFLIFFPFLIKWARGKFNLKDQIIGFFPLALTLIPQALFEVKNKFLMSKALLASMTVENDKLPWAVHLKDRFLQLLHATQNITIRGRTPALPVFLILLGVVLWMIYMLFFKIKVLEKAKIENLFAWRLMAVLATIPYPFYLFWRGNSGYFFDYYITAHFVLLVPLFALAIFSLPKIFSKRQAFFRASGWAFLGMIFLYSYQFMYGTTLLPVNNAGLRAMDSAVEQLYVWIADDKQEVGVIRVFTPNRETEHYDTIIHWRAKELGREIPLTVQNGDEDYWYVLIEPDRQLKKRLRDWYGKVTAGGVCIRRTYSGDLKVETFIRESVYNENPHDYKTCDAKKTF